ncbi:hypothetical protein ACWF50_19645 [Brucella pseudogrignonensis]
MMGRFLKRHFPGLTAGVCGLLLLPWILGVPGNPTPRAAFVWTAGLLAMIAYLVVYQSVRSSKDHAFFNRPSMRIRLDRALFTLAVFVWPILSGSLLFLVLGTS